MLVWAREERGLSLQTAAKRVGIRPERLAASESGNEKLTFPQLRKAAWVYRRPTATFFLHEPPPPMSIPKFRRLPDNRGQPLSPELKLQVRRIKQMRRAAIRLQEYGPSFDWDYVGSVSVEDDPEQVGERIRTLLGIQDRFPIGMRDYQTFNSWRSSLERLGVLVFLISGVDVEEMRGFSMAQFPFPTIAVNRKDHPHPRSFTLLHEAVHILLGESSLCEIPHKFGDATAESQRVESFCNHAAAAALVPARLLLAHQVVKEHGSSESWQEKELEKLATRFRVSKEAILRRLLTVDKTSREFYGHKKQQWNERVYQERKGSPRERYHEKILRVDGLTYTSIVLDALHDNAITPAEVSELLNMNLKHLPALEKLMAEKGV